MTNLGFFCDYSVNPDNTKAPPIHGACSGKTIINWGLETELVVDCQCSCHKLKVIE